VFFYGQAAIGIGDPAGLAAGVMGEEQRIPSTSSGQVAGLTDQVAQTVKESANPAH